MNNNERAAQIIKASWIGIIGNSILAILKITIGFLSGSLSVIGDGIDSASDIATYFITLVTAHIIKRPPDSKHPFGYFKAETIATKLLSTLIFFVGINLAYSTISNLMAPDEASMPSELAIYVTIFSIIGKYILATWQLKIGNEAKSSMIIANARNMKNDILLSMGVLVGLIMTFYFELPIFDSIIAFMVSLWIMTVGVRIFLSASLELMDGVDDTSLYQKIFESVAKVEGASNPHRIRIRKVANLYMIDLDIEVDGKITVNEAHEIGSNVELMIKENIENVYDIMVHFEPIGNIENDEAFGISESRIS